MKKQNNATIYLLINSLELIGYETPELSKNNINFLTKDKFFMLTKEVDFVDTDFDIVNDGETLSTVIFRLWDKFYTIGLNEFHEVGDPEYETLFG